MPDNEVGHRENGYASTENWLEATRGMVISCFVEEGSAIVSGVWPFAGTTKGAVGTVSLRISPLS
jgi:hypothetical protein